MPRTPRTAGTPGEVSRNGGRTRNIERRYIDGGAVSRYSNAIINDEAGGLVLYWKLDELGNTTSVMADSSGNGLDGLYGSGSAHPTLGLSALADGTAATFDGVDDIAGYGTTTGGTYVDVPGIQANGQMSIEFWVKTTQSTASLPAIVSSDTSSSDGRFFKVRLRADGTIAFAFFGTDGTAHGPNGLTPINDGARHHVVCTFDGVTAKIYIDGVLDTTDTPAMGGFPLADHNHGLWIGCGAPQPGGFFVDPHFAGTLDEVALYTVALPLDSITTHYLLGSTASNPPSGVAGGDLDGTYPDPIIRALAVTTGKIADAAVTTAKIAAGAVTAAKLSLSVTDLLDAVARVKVAVGGALIGTRRETNFIAGTGISISAVDDAVNEKVDVTIGTSGGGGGSGSMTVLFDSTLAADAASIDTGAGGIASGHTAILIVMLIQTADASGTAVVNMRINNDTGANYDTVGVVWTGSGVSGGSSIGLTSWQVTMHGAGGSTNYPSSMQILIPSYDKTTFWKTGTGITGANDGTASNNRTNSGDFGWRSTAAITRFAVFANSGANLKAGSRMIVYGIG